MHALMRVWALLWCYLYTLEANAQDNHRTDSLMSLLKTKTADTNRVNVLNELAFEWSPTGSALTLRYGREALQLALKLKYPQGVARAYSNIGVYYDYAGNYDSAMVFYNKALDQNTELGDHNALAGNYLNIGASYLYRGLYKPALENTITAYKIYAGFKNEKRMVSCLNNMGIIYRATKEYKKALDNYTEVLAIRKRNRDERGLMVTYTNIGVVYQNLKDYRNFLSYSDTALQLARKVGNINDVSGSMLNVGLAYIRLLRYNEAEKMLNETLVLTQTSGDRNNEAYCYAALGELRLDQARYSEAIPWFKKSLVLAEALGRAELLNSLYSYLYQASKKLNRYEDALYYLEREKSLNDSLLNRETLRQTSEIDAIYKTAEKEKENQRLKTENEMQKLSAGWANTQRNIFVGVSVVVLVLLLLILRAYLHKQKTNRLLEDNRQAIEHSLHEKETLLREIHHRVKNNLQIISSLLELQLNRISDESIVALLKESKNRIESMALIHKKLYTHNNFAAIAAGDYLRDLAQSLRVSYLKSGIQLEIVYSIEPMEINTETAVPLGLIVTEVVSNALKHAIHAQAGNRIEIMLKKENGNGFMIHIRDNGPGLYDTEVLLNSGSLGLKLVRILSRQLEGEAVFKNENGLLFQLNGKIIGMT